MKLALWLPPVALALALAGCAPAESPAPAVPTKSRLVVQREEFFGAAVAADPAVKWQPTGLGVKVIAPGSGVAPGLGDRVRVNYSGRLKDGTVFDATAPGRPAEFALDRLIPGLVAGLESLPPGGRAVLYIPPSLGYGSMRAGKIPPVSGLIFEVELVAVNP